MKYIRDSINILAAMSPLEDQYSESFYSKLQQWYSKQTYFYKMVNKVPCSLLVKLLRRIRLLIEFIVCHRQQYLSWIGRNRNLKCHKKGSDTGVAHKNTHEKIR